MAMMLPDELAWLLEMLGFDWPTANEDHMMQCAQTWRDFGAQVGDIQSDAMRSAGNVTSDNYGESIDAFVEKWDNFAGGSGYLDDARQAAEVIASVFDVAAMLIIGMKIAVIIQLIVLAVQIAVAAATAVVTFGISAAASAAMTQVTRIAVRKILKEAAQALLEAALEAVKEPFVSALEEMSKDLVAQTVNQNFGAQDGYNLGRTAEAGKTAVKDGFDNFGSTLGESLRDGAGGRAGSHARGGLDGAAGNSSSSGGADGDAGAGAGSSGGGAGSGAGSGSGSGGDGAGGTSGGAGAGAGSGGAAGGSGSGSAGSGAGSGASGSGSGSGDGGGTAGASASGDTGDTGTTGSGSGSAEVGSQAGSNGDAGSTQTPTPTPSAAPSSDRPLTPFDAGYHEQRATPGSSTSSDAGGSTGPSGTPDSSPGSTSSTGSPGSTGSQSTPDAAPSPGTPDVSTGTDAQRNASETATPAPAAQSDPSSSVPHARVDTDTNTPSPAPTPTPSAGPSDASHSINTASESAAPTQESNGPAAQIPSPDRGNDPSTATDPRTQVQQPTTTAMPAGTPTPTDTSSPASTSTTPGSIPSAGTGAHTGSDSHSRTSSSPTFHSQSATATEAHAPTRPAPTATPTPTGDSNATTPTPNQTPNVAPTATPGPVTNTPTNTPTTPTQGPSRQPTPTTNPRTDTPRTEAPHRTTPTPTRREPTTPSTPRPNTPTNNRPGTTNSNPNTPNQPGISATPTPNQAPNQAPNPAPSQTPNQPANQAPNQAPNQNQPATQAPNQSPSQSPNQPVNQGPSQTPNQPANPAPNQTPNQPTNQTPNQAPTQVPVQIPIQTPNNNPGAQQPSSNGHPAQESSDTTPPKPDQPAPLSQGQSLQQIRDSLNHAPYGLLTPDPAHQQALQDAVPRNEDGTPQRHPDPNGEWAQLQNDGGLQQPGRSNNCLDNARAGLSTWFGNPQVSAPRTPDKNHDGTLDTMSPERDSYNNLDAWAGRPQIWAGADHPGPYARIAHHLQEAGPGSAAVVGVQWPGGGGHAFNVYNHNGQIIWVDHQTGEVSPNPIHTGAAGVRYVPFDSNGQTMDAPWEKKQDTETEASDASESSDSDSSNSSNTSESTNASDSDSSQSADSSQSSESPQPDQEQGGYGSDSTASYGAAPEQPNQDQQQGQQEQGQQQEEGQSRRDLDPTRANRNGGLVAENSGDLQQGVAPDPIQASLRESHSVYRTDLDAVHQTMRDWVDPEKHPEAPLSGLLEQAAERRKAYEKAMEPIETPRRALQAALIEERAIEKQVKEHEKNGETDQATALKDGKLAEAAERRAEAQQVHDEAVENHRGTKVPPTAFTDAELRDALGEKFATMNDGEKYAVIAAIARMSNSFHADNAVGNSPERPPDSHSPYEGTTKGSGNNQVPNPAQSDHESSAARRRNEAAADLPPKYRSDTESKKAFANLRSVFNESVAEDLSSVKRRKIQDLLEAALESGTGPDLSGKNYAVVELVDAKGNSTYVVDSSVPAGLDAVSPLHSESHILNWIDTVNGATEPGVDPKYTIAGLYTEREPCGSRELNSGYAECSRTIAQHESMNGVPVYYSTTYRHSDKESKNRMDEELADHLAVVAETWIHVRTQMVGSNGHGDPAA